MIIYGTLDRQIFTRRSAIWTLPSSKRQIRVTAKDNGNGTATVWEKIWDEDGTEGTAKHPNVSLSQVVFVD